MSDATQTAGPAPTRTEIDDRIDAWHDTPNGITLHEALGWTTDEYGEWLRDPSIVPQRPLSTHELRRLTAEHVGTTALDGVINATGEKILDLVRASVVYLRATWRDVTEAEIDAAWVWQAVVATETTEWTLTQVGISKEAIKIVHELTTLLFPTNPVAGSQSLASLGSQSALRVAKAYNITEELAAVLPSKAEKEATQTDLKNRIRPQRRHFDNGLNRGY